MFCDASESTNFLNTDSPAVLQVSVLTDQVEVQGEKIRDLDSCLEHHREKLNATEELLQQVTPPRASRCPTAVRCGLPEA